jgi:hypothetical protein
MQQAPACRPGLHIASRQWWAADQLPQLQHQLQGLDRHSPVPECGGRLAGQKYAGEEHGECSCGPCMHHGDAHHRCCGSKAGFWRLALQKIHDQTNHPGYPLVRLYIHLFYVSCLRLPSCSRAGARLACQMPPAWVAWAGDISLGRWLILGLLALLFNPAQAQQTGACAVAAPTIDSTRLAALCGASPASQAPACTILRQ